MAKRTRDARGSALKRLEECLDGGIFLSVENPSNSIMWQTRWFMSLLNCVGMKEVLSQNCMFGGGRPKRSSWWANMPELEAPGQLCDGKHTHGRWGASKVRGKPAFATTLEAEYQPALCKEAAEAVARCAARMGKAWRWRSNRRAAAPC